LESVPLTKELLEECDLVIILSDHSCIDYRFVVETAKHVLDTRNATKHIAEFREKITLL
jgi:UDP-N-acetyl-D-glucosamine dehydrogenase